MNEKKNVLLQDKQQEIAHGCAITIVTEPHLAVQRAPIYRSLQRAFPAVCADPLDATRYDLLAVPNLDEVVNDNTRFELLVEDVRTALGLHQTEYLAAITEEGIQTRLIEKLAGDPQLSGVTMRGCRVPSRKTAPGGLLALTCMDWRLHGCGGFVRQLRRACGRRLGGIMTLPGAAKDINAATERGRVAVASLSDLIGAGFDELMIVSHTDCGKYGGHQAFAGAGEESRRLSDDLCRAAAFLRSHLNVEIGLGIAEIAGSRTERVIKLAPIDASRACSI